MHVVLFSNVMAVRYEARLRVSLFLSKERLPLARALVSVWLFGVLVGLPAQVAADAVIHHDLRIVLEPTNGRITVEDRIRLPDDAQTDSKRRLQFSLHSGLEVDTNAELALLHRSRSVRRYAVLVPPDRNTITVRYAGRMQERVDTSTTGPRADPQDTTGIISEQGVYLDGSSQWYPRFDAELVTFSLRVDSPAGWTVVSQGVEHANLSAAGRHSVVWIEQQPQDDIYLIAGRYHTYRRTLPVAELMVFLRQPSAELAKRYLDAAEHYVPLYSRLLGPYPYAKFALVENFWESGYGMPSFTLLGSRVIRLPFIVNSSFPHEILHNWWGNGVYVDLKGGNWSEGLTAYLADHLVQETRGLGSNYRRAALQKYANYVGEAQDFPLREFRGRHGEASQAVGYNKALMFFHMLRRRVGDQSFIRALRRFYMDNKFRRASFSDLKDALEVESGKRLGVMFEQWTERSGAPQLRITDVHRRERQGQYHITGLLHQVQGGPYYELDVPLKVYLDNQDDVFQSAIRMNARHTEFDLRVPSKPVRLAVDGEFDVFRRLDPREIPASVGQIFGAARVLSVLPSAAPPGLQEAYAGIAKRWFENSVKVKHVYDDELTTLPQDRAVWLFGWENRFRFQLAPLLRSAGMAMGPEQISIKGRNLDRAEHSVLLVARNAQEIKHGLGWLGADNRAAMPGLGRKIPHYGKYSYLAFTDDEPSNVLKGQWRVVNSPLSVDFEEGLGIVLEPVVPSRLDLTKALPSLPLPN